MANSGRDSWDIWLDLHAGGWGSPATEGAVPRSDGHDERDAAGHEEPDGVPARSPIGVVVCRASLPAGAQGCLVNGTRCHSGEECCSGLCKRKRDGKKLCKPAENQGLCTVEEDHCSDSDSITCGTSSESGDCYCYVTTKGRSFCGNRQFILECNCTSNEECERHVGKGTKCVAMGVDPSPPCAVLGTCSTGTGCMPPCATLDPVP